MNIYKLTKIILYPIILVADYLQTNHTKFFTLMNIGPVNDPALKKMILKHLSYKNYVLDYGCGVGFFCKIFNKKRYLGLEINRKFLQRAKKINKGYKFLELKDKKVTKFKNKINAVFINNVLHHMSDNQINLALQFLKKNSKKNTKLLIIEPLLPKKIFSLQFFLKALDIGNFIRDKKNYLRVIKKYVDIDSVFLKKIGISSVIVFFGYLRK
jgi:SAM-dependent methyltransferase